MVVLSGFNFHLKCLANEEAANFKNILNMHDSKFFLAELTHEQGGWLGVVATKVGLKVGCIDVFFQIIRC